MQTMVSCEYVLENLSNLIDDDLNPGLRAEIEAHLKGCKRCSALHDSLSKVLIIVFDERILKVPLKYTERVHKFIDSII